MTAYIYKDHITGHSVEAIFSRFVEVCGSLLQSDRRKPGTADMSQILCDAMAWYFNLMSKLGIADLEKLIFRKYPLVSSYCLRSPHSDLYCKSLSNRTEHSERHQKLRQLYLEHLEFMPKELDDWCDMFQSIYPRSAFDEHGRSILGLMEELGELAQAIRILGEAPHYAAGEAADVFSYLSGMVNEHRLRLLRSDEKRYSIQLEYARRYPGVCSRCQHEACNCLSFATLLGPSKEIPISGSEDLFGES